DSFGQGSGQATLTVSVPTGATSGDHRITVVASSAGQTWSSTATVAVEGVDADVVRFSTVGNQRPPGVPGTPDDADILRWRSGGGVTEWLDLSAPPFALPARADVDGFSQGRGRRFFVSFAHSIRVPGLGRVHDEDVVRFDGTRWRLWFDGSRHGLGARTGIDAVSVSRGRLFFSTDRRAKPPGVGGSGDDADIYRWQGRRFSRVWDASRHGLPRRADIDGLHVAGTNRLAMSFRSARTRISGFAGVGDEDIVGFHGGQWTLVFDGGGHGLRGPGRDIDAFDLR
ncbi:hypothetical protein, partial [Nocardioides sp.]|uniref:hypothetical protein n=1 Tax=Nocardioides sp. TaxID=35761 RepID=UPI003563A920